MKTILAFLMVMLLVLYSCQEDPEIAGAFEESYAAYCLLNLKDSVQYVRINRVFFCSGDPADHFQDPDSVNVDPEVMEVSLVALKDGLPEGEPVLFFPTDGFTKEDGLFSSEDYIVFRSNVPLVPDRTYRLVIRNTDTGFEMIAETALLGGRPLSYAFAETRYYNINQYQPESIDYQGSLITSQFDKRIFRLLYYEYRNEQPEMKYIDWRSPYSKSFGPAGADSGQISDDLLRYFAENIPVVPGLKRKAVGMDKMLLINHEMVTLFIGYAGNLSSAQYVPGFTNFDKGVGLFSSRYYYTFFAMGLRPSTLDSLSYGRFTKDLGFADSGGNWPPNEESKR
jgi:hypothetical protein